MSKQMVSGASIARGEQGPASGSATRAANSGCNRNVGQMSCGASVRIHIQCSTINPPTSTNKSE